MMPDAVFNYDLWCAVRDLSSILFRKFANPNGTREEEYWWGIAKRAIFHGETYSTDRKVITYISDWLWGHRKDYNGAIYENLGVGFFRETI